MSNFSNVTLAFTFSNFPCGIDWEEYCPCLQPDPDIAGDGVIYSSIAASIMTLVLASVLTLVDTDENDWTLVDRRTVKYAKAWFSDTFRERIMTISRPVIISLSDLQLLSGLSTLFIVFVRYRTMSSYHFAIVNTYSGIAFLAHSTSMDCMSSWIVQKETASRSTTTASAPSIYRISNNRNTKPSLHYYLAYRTIKASLMVAHYFLLMASLVIVGRHDYFEYLNCPTRCMTEYPEYNSFDIGLVALWILITTPGFVTSLLNLFSPTRSALFVVNRFFARFLYNPISRTYHNLRSPKRPVTVRYLALIVGVLGTLPISQVGIWALWIYWIGSSIDDIAWLQRTGRGIMRDNADYGCGVTEQTETQWGFGQILPVILLFLPLIALVESVEDLRVKINEVKATSGDSELAQTSRRSLSRSLASPRSSRGSAAQSMVTLPVQTDTTHATSMDFQGPESSQSRQNTGDLRRVNTSNLERQLATEVTMHGALSSSPVEEEDEHDT